MTENNMRQHLWDLCGLEDGELDCHKHHLKVTVETIYDDRSIRLTTSPVDMAIFLADYKLVKRLCEKDFKVSFLEEGDIYLDIDLDQIEKKTDSNDWNRTPITLGNILLMHAYEMPVECLHALQEACITKHAVSVWGTGKHFDSVISREEVEAAILGLTDFVTEKCATIGFRMKKYRKTSEVLFSFSYITM